MKKDIGLPKGDSSLLDLINKITVWNKYNYLFIRAS